MGYSVARRQRVIQSVHSGGGKAEAARRFQVSRVQVYVWLALSE
jgi:transposase-like protein